MPRNRSLHQRIKVLEKEREGKVADIKKHEGNLRDNPELLYTPGYWLKELENKRFELLQIDYQLSKLHKLSHRRSR